MNNNDLNELTRNIIESTRLTLPTAHVEELESLVSDTECSIAIKWALDWASEGLWEIPNHLRPAIREWAENHQRQWDYLRDATLVALLAQTPSTTDEQWHEPDFSKLDFSTARPSDYYLRTTSPIPVPYRTLDYFDDLATRFGVPTQRLVNNLLRYASADRWEPVISDDGGIESWKRNE
jgi:hypothetical protein